MKAEAVNAEKLDTLLDKLALEASEIGMLADEVTQLAQRLATKLKALNRTEERITRGGDPLAEYADALGVPYIDELSEWTEYRRIARRARGLAQAAERVNRAKLLAWLSDPTGASEPGDEFARRSLSDDDDEPPEPEPELGEA